MKGDPLLYILFANLAYLSFIIGVTVIAYRLGKTKTENPKLAAVIGFFLALIPLFGLIYIAVLALKEDAGVV
jgi:hypothetical protein